MDDRDKLYKLDSADDFIEEVSVSSAVNWLCEQHHYFKATSKSVHKNGCPYCKLNTVNLTDLNTLMKENKSHDSLLSLDEVNLNWQPSGDKLPPLDPKVWQSIVTSWGVDTEYQDALNSMYASLKDKQVIDIMLSTFEKYPTKGLLNKMTETVTQEDIVQRKIDVSIPALKKFSKHLDREINKDTFELQQSILAEIKFLGAMSMSKKWHTFVAWHFVTDPDVIYELDESLNGDGTYISAVVFPNNAEEPRSYVYPTKKSEVKLDELGRAEEVFDRKLLGLSPSQKVIMLPFYQANGLASYFNDPEFSTEMYKMKKKIQINTIQERFVYVRQFLCGLSQNKLAFWLNQEGIDIDNKGIKYWEEKQTDEPSFVKNHWKDVLKVLSEHSYYLLHLEMANDLYRADSNNNWSAVSIKQVQMFLNDFILYGSQDSIRFDIPKIIQLSTELKIKDSKDLLWENAKLKKMSSTSKGKAIKVKDVTAKSGYLQRWINFFLDKDETEILEDLDQQYDDEDTKKEVYYLWHKANQLYKPKTKKTPKKTKKGQIDPPFP